MDKDGHFEKATSIPRHIDPLHDGEGSEMDSGEDDVGDVENLSAR